PVGVGLGPDLAVPVNPDEHDLVEDGFQFLVNPAQEPPHLRSLTSVWTHPLPVNDEPVLLLQDLGSRETRLVGQGLHVDLHWKPRVLERLQRDLAGGEGPETQMVNGMPLESGGRQVHVERLPAAVPVLNPGHQLGIQDARLVLEQRQERLTAVLIQPDLELLPSLLPVLVGHRPLQERIADLPGEREYRAHDASAMRALSFCTKSCLPMTHHHRNLVESGSMLPPPAATVYSARWSMKNCSRVA